MEIGAVRTEPPASCALRVAVDAPLWGTFDYLHVAELVPGTLVRVPFGRQRHIGVVLGDARPRDGLRPIEAVIDALAPLGADWVALLEFTAGYYQRPLGELMAAALPTWLRTQRAAAVDARLQRSGARALAWSAADPDALRAALPSRAVALRRLADALAAPTPLSAEQARSLHPRAPSLLRDWAARGWVHARPACAPAARAGAAPALLDAQRAALDAVQASSGFAPFLLFGVTGSGKTEVYLQLAAQALARQPRAQVLVLTPEINLTPQLLQRFAERFPGERLAVLHSGLAEAERFDHWAAAHSGQARIVLGTRLAVLASLPQLALVLVDEEHDASYKQQEGARYSARDLAVWRARQRGVAVVLGSATPSLESWRAAARGRYRLLELPARAAGALPAVRLADAARDTALRSGALLGTALREALAQRLARGEQSLLFLNRRGYAPVLRCPDCGWLSDCPHCDAHLVYHRTDRSLRCHHCGHRTAVPRACPDCGSLDLQPLGRGTQRVEEALAEAFPAARIARIDADTARRKGAAQDGFARVHAGDVDILVGTQMVTKGHDFQRVTLVAALNPDSGLFSHDPRAPERLFAQLMQAAGRAGRAAVGGSVPEMLVQTAYPQHPLYAALAAHDYRRFAADELRERERAGMPPFSHQALLRAEHARAEQVEAFLARAGELAADAPAGVVVYPPVPAALARVAGVHRQQMLVEASARGALQAFVRRWRAALAELAAPRVRWAIDVDPTDY